MPRNQVGIIGYGNIGSKIVDLLLRDNIQPLVVVRNPDKAKALKDDYYPAQLGSDIRPIFTTNYEQLTQADSVIVTASAPVEVIADAKNRNKFIEYNTPIMANIGSKLAQNIAKDTLIVTVSNPVEAMVYILRNAGNFEARNVLGVGTAVEAARYETLISETLGIACEQVVSTVIGAHNENDSVFLPQCTKISQLPLSHFNLAPQKLLELENKAKMLGWTIFNQSNQAAAITPAALAVNLAKAHLNTDVKRVVNCTIEVPLEFINQMLGNDAIDSNESTVALGILALLNYQGAEPQKIPNQQINTSQLKTAIQNIIKQQQIARAILKNHAAFFKN